MGTERSATKTDTAINHIVIESVADTTNVSPVELSTPLYDVIDPDALERVFARESANGKVVFHYHGCEVTVFSDGNVSVKQDNT